MTVFKNLLLASILLLVFSNCKDNPKVGSKEKTSAEKIRELYTSTPKISLPFTWYNTRDDFPMRMVENGLLKDSSLFTEGLDRLTLRAAFPDTSKFFAFFFVSHGDDLTPVIITFNKAGKMVTNKLLGFGCGSDCGYSCGNGVFTMESDLTFRSKIQDYTAQCDSVGNIMPPILFRMYEKKGKISSNGKITESAESIIESRTIPADSPENPFK